MTLRALELWRAHDSRRRLLHETGVLWLFGDDDGFGRASAEVLRAHGARLDALTLTEAARRYPQIAFGGVRSVFWEPDAGYLLARRACEDVVEHLTDAGGEYRRAGATTPVVVEGRRLERLPLEGGGSLDADVFVFACGPWLPAAISRRGGPADRDAAAGGALLRPAGGRLALHRARPAGVDGLRRRFQRRPDLRRTGRRRVWIQGGRRCAGAADGSRPAANAWSAPDSVARARAFLSIRFPALAGAPLVASEVCQYETTLDAHLILDRHPQASNVWIAGGGSGHGFKMGPAIGEMMARVLLDDETPDPQFSLSRFASPPASGWSGRWS